MDEDIGLFGVERLQNTDKTGDKDSEREKKERVKNLSTINKTGFTTITNG